MLIYHILICAILIFFFWLWRQPEMQDLVNRMCVPIAKALNTEYQDEMIKLCIDDYYRMVERIKASTSAAEIESWYWEIDHFRNHYINIVPDALVNGQSEKLKVEVDRKKDELIKYKWAITSSQIGLQ